MAFLGTSIGKVRFSFTLSFFFCLSKRVLIGDEVSFLGGNFSLYTSAAFVNAGVGGLKSKGSPFSGSKNSLSKFVAILPPPSKVVHSPSVPLIVSTEPNLSPLIHCSLSCYILSILLSLYSYYTLKKKFVYGLLFLWNFEYSP